MKAPADTSSEKVPLITKLAFGSGDVGPAVVTAIMSFFLLYFLTDIARISPAVAGLILLINKIWDAFNDPIIGMFSDRVHTRWGRRRPWFLFGAIPFGLTFFLLFLVPDIGATGKFWYYLIVSLMLDTAFTVVNVPYTALTPELSRDYDERTSLNSYRFAFSIGSGLIAAVVHPIIVNAVKAGGGTEQVGYMVSAAVWAVVATVPFFFAFRGTYERHTAEEEETMPFLEGLKFTFSNVAFRYVTGVYLLSWLVVQTVATIVVYYLTYWMRQPGLVPAVILAVQGSALVWLFIWTAISRQVSKKGVYYVLGALAGMGVATAYLVPWAMLPDVIELDELKTGKRREGAYYGFFVLLQKVGLAVGLFMVSQALALSGYITPPAGTTTPIVQPDSALLAIRLMIGPIPALILAAGIYLVYRFPITRAGHQETLKKLAACKAAVTG
ncbi:MAG: MFS transporter [Anaerolineae bacterium]